MVQKFSLWESPVSADEPSGKNIEYDSRFLELQNAAEGKAEQQYGEIIFDAQGPEWGKVEKLCHQLLAESKDLRLFSYYGLVLTAKYGLMGFAAACEALKINLELFWDTLYPPLTDEDGEYDPFYRLNALSLFTFAHGIAKELASAKLLINGLTQQSVTVREAVAVLQDQNTQNYPGGKERLILDIRVCADGEKPELQAVSQSIQHLQAVNHIIAKHLGSNEQLDFSPLLKELTLIQQAMAYENKIEPADKVNNDSTIVEKENKSVLLTAHTPVFADTSPNADAWRQLNIKNRSDVDLVLEKICVYFENFEPSHPAPLFIRRVQKFMNMNFYDIMMDISPNSISNLEMLIGKPKEKEDE